MSTLLFLSILVPLIAALVIWGLPQKAVLLKAAVMLIGVTISLVFAIILFRQEAVLSFPWGGFGMDFSLRVYNLSGFIVLAAAVITFLVALYSVTFMWDKKNAGNFYGFMMLTLCFVIGAALANNLIVLLFFWEGLSIPLYGMIMAGGKDNYAVTVKALILNGIADLSVMLGVAFTEHAAGTLAMDAVFSVPMDFSANFAFICLMIGAIGKAGAVPFHTWIPDASEKAPLPFMALVPAALQKLIAVYLLYRVCVDFFSFDAHSGLSIALLVIASVTIIIGVMMALVQKDFKRMVSYLAISQVGYVLLGLGSAMPSGIVGGLFQMFNLVIVISCLFMIAGSVEKQTGTTDITKLGGLGKAMPITSLCFLLAAFSMAGVPLFTGFYSQVLVFDGAMQANLVFYLIALLGNFFTALALLKLGHAVFFGKAKEGIKAKEVAPAMWLSIAVLAAFTFILGILNVIIIEGVIQPVVGEALLKGEDFAGILPYNSLLALASILVIALALLIHVYGYRKSADAFGAVETIHKAPFFSKMYDLAEARYFDTYEILTILLKAYGWIAFTIDRAINWFYDVFLVRITAFASMGLKNSNNGTGSRYVSWSLLGVVMLLVVFIGMNYFVK
ncbi:MAG: proton-conducting transporter membrane subunit [Clostridia bacterium]|nr:proton-conducting transporter membrane subunit [Clostridia bacterium]